jgi:competence protein ComEA
VHDGVSTRVGALLARAGLGAVPRGALVAIALFAVTLIVAGAARWLPDNEPVGEFAYEQAGETDAGASDAAPPAEAEESTESSVVVYVVGAVRRPGVIRLAAGARVDEAVAAAGGLLGNAATEAVNLARPAVDGEQIVVPTQDEWDSRGSVAGTPAQPGGTGAGTAAEQPVAQIDLNTADAAALETLPGVGPATAAKIIADREANGPFGSAEDLMRVPGIGPKKFEAMSELVVVR